MIKKLYIPVKYKTKTKVYWLEDKGKVYIDNILVKKYDSLNLFNSNKDYLFRQGEKAVFYTYKDKAYIEDAEGNKTTLKYCITYKEKHISKDYLNTLLELHGGLSIHKIKKNYVILSKTI